MKKFFRAFLAAALVGCGALSGCAAKHTAAASSPSSAAGGKALSQTKVVSYLSKDSYPDFFAAGKAAFVIPGLKQGLVPQGMCYVASQQYFVISYYSETNSPSVLAVVDAKSGKLTKSVFLANEDGTPYAGHAGGVAASSRSLWTMSDGVAYRIELDDLNRAASLSTLKFKDHFQTATKASMGNCVDGVLWIGDFYTAGGSYNTDDSHHLNAPDGTMHYAWAAGYKLDSSTENELSAADYQNETTMATPDYVLSLPDKIQGMTRLSSGEFVLSESYGRKNDSHILVYQNVMQQSAAATVPINGKNIPLWFLDAKSQLKSLTAPPMTESIESSGEGIYVLFESGSELYRDTAVSPMDELYQLSSVK